MKIGINPTVDFACKRLLGSPNHPAITLHFLNAVLRLPTPIRDVQILNPTIEKEFQSDKWALLDILATDESGRMINIEIQRTRPSGLRRRLTYYAACLLSGQLNSGHRYENLRPSIGICLLDAIEFRDLADLRHEFRLRSDTGIELTDCLQVHLFELPKYTPPSDNRVVSDPIEQWLYFFAAAEGSTPDELTARLADPVFAEATGVLEMISKDPLERVLYEFRLKAERDEIARTEQAIRDGQEQGLAEGLAEGRQKGLAEGLAEGRQKGLAEGLAEGRDEGELVGRVKALQSLSGITPATSEELLRLGKPALMAMEQELQARLRDRLR